MSNKLDRTQLSTLNPEELAALLGGDPTTGRRPKEKELGTLVFQWWDQGRLRSSSLLVPWNPVVDLDKEESEALTRKRLTSQFDDLISQNRDLARLLKIGGGHACYTDGDGKGWVVWPKLVGLDDRKFTLFSLSTA